MLALVAWGASPARAQSVSAGEIRRDVEKSLPLLQPPQAQDFSTRPRESPQERKRLIDDPSPELPSDSSLGSPIKKIFVVSPLLKQEIQEIVRRKAFGEFVSKDDLALLRQEIWALGVANKRLLHTKFKVIPNPKEGKGSWLIVEAVEIVVRRVIVEAEGEIRQGILESIKEQASKEFYQDKVLDLDELDNTIKTRLRLGDVHLHTSVVPVDPTHVDLKVLVRAVPKVSSTGLVQYDNEGGWAFGRDRVIGGVSFFGVNPGDTVTLMAMKSADIGNWDWGNGTYFGRAEYQAPIGEWGVRLETWASGLHYHEVAAVPSNAKANGEALEYGLGVIRPIFAGERTSVDARADFVARYSVDRTDEDVRTGEKAEFLGRARMTLMHQLWEEHFLQLDLTLSEGTIDLSGNPQAYRQDQLGPKANGIFTKFEEEAAWLGKLGQDRKIDFRLALKGQWTPNNLDSTEKFSLGGAKGLRAFGSGEASGDAGLIFSEDVGYLLDYGIHPYVFSDAGVIWKDVRSWPGRSGLNCYHLFDVGAGVSKSIENLNMSLVFAHQLGPNFGLTAQGLDVDNTSQRFRVWATLSYRY